MKITIFLLSLSLLGCSLHASKSRAITEQIEHHEQTVEVSDDPADCIVCHDSQAGKDHHPIKIAYPPEGKKDLFLPAAASTPNRIRLFNGQVVCTSCHNLKNPEKSHLAAGNNSSTLCLLCHKK